jgi:hypothetical protein
LVVLATVISLLIDRPCADDDLPAHVNADVHLVELIDNRRTDKRMAVVVDSGPFSGGPGSGKIKND